MTTIDVTAEDIKASRRPTKEDFVRSTSCPIARAGRRAFHGMCVSVTGDTFCVHLGQRPCTQILTRTQLPPEAVQFIETFDSNGRKAVQPFSFEVP